MVDWRAERKIVEQERLNKVGKHLDSLVALVSFDCFENS